MFSYLGFCMNFPFYSHVSKDLKHSLPVGLGLSETKITSHSSDNTKEGVIEAGPFQGNSNCLNVSIFNDNNSTDIGLFQNCMKSTPVISFSDLTAALITFV